MTGAAVIAALTSMTAAMARQGPPHLLHFGRQQGLSDDTVWAILEDSRGFMWLGTSDGLNRFDGLSFVVYRHDPGNPGSLRQNTVRALLEDRAGRLWIGTLGGLDRYDRETDAFSHFRHEPGDPASLGNDNVHSLFEDSQGVLWVGTLGGLYRFDQDAGTFELWSANESLPYRELRILGLFEDRQGNLWIGTRSAGALRWDRRTGAVAQYLFPSTLSRVVHAIVEDREGDVWLATLDGLQRFDRELDRFVSYRHDADDAGSLATDHIEALLLDRRGLLWIGTDGGGMAVFDQGAKSFVRFEHDPEDDTTLRSQVVRTIYEDSRGDLWFGTYTGGVSYYNRNNEAFSYYRRRQHGSGSLSQSSVLSFFDEGEVIWIGTEDGLNRFEPETGAFRSFRHDERDPTSLSAKAVLSVHVDRSGDLWAGTFFGGLNRLDRARGTFERFQPDDGPGSLSNPHVWDILEDSTGQLWLGTFGGVYRLGPERKTFVPYRHVPEDEASIGHDICVRILEDRAGNLWMATQGGLSRYDRDRDRFRTYRQVRKGQDNSGRDHLLTMAEDRYGKIWLGTAGGGLNVFDPATESFKSFSREQGLPNSTVKCIVEDDGGSLWISTNDGLSRLDPQRRTFTNLDRSDGLAAFPFNKDACVRSRSGEIYFGGTEGFNRFDPRDVKQNAFLPPIVLTDFQVFDKPATVGGAEGVLDRQITEAEQILLRHDQSVIRFSFAALNYRAPEKNQYAYRLEPFDDDWRYVGTQRSATYTNLDPGSYVFRVKGSNNSGLWNEKGASITVRVLPPFWATWWFRAAALLLSVTALYGLYHARTRGIRGRNARLQAEIEERRRVELERERLLLEMEQKNKTLEEQNAELERFTYTVSHDLKSPLVTISGFLGLLRKDALSGDKARIETDVKSIGEAVDKMHRLLAELLELSRIGRLMNPPERVPLTELVADARASVAGLTARHGVAIETAPEMPDVYGDRGRLLEVFQNLLENAAKFMGEQPAPRIEVGARAQGREVLCWVRDNGIGIDPRYHEKVFGLFERLDPSVEGTGVGLALVKRIVELHGGRIWVESEGVGLGCAFYFTIAGLTA